jgi:hypothetical protein
MSVRAHPCVIGALVAASLGAHAARAQSPGPSPMPDHMPPAQAMTRLEMDRRATRRFPQPVRVGDLAERNLLQPTESQPVLGRIAGLARRGDGETEVVIRLDGWFGLSRLGLRSVDWAGVGPRLVAVPLEAVALLGEHVALMDLKPERLRALPTFAPEAAATIGPDETVRVGLVRPFH